MADGDAVTDRTPLLQRKDSASSFEVISDMVLSIFEQPSDSNQLKNYNFSCGTVNGAVDASDVCPEIISETEIDVKSSDVVCIFAVAFDARAGNIIEWHLPEDCNLDGIEFRAMASGSHRVQTDFIYFKRDKLFGLACFENMPVENVEERGARMKSLGILSTTYTSLHLHMNFLRRQVRYLLENPGCYSTMESYYEKCKGILPSSESFAESAPISIQKHEALMLPLMTIMHPAGCFSQFMKFFGENIFNLWKMALLKKRIIFFSPPPIGVVCYRVYCTSILSIHRLLELETWCARPLFYINVADMELLETEKSYIACTTEKIFESKSSLYDLYVDNQNLVSKIPIIQKAITLSPAMRKKFEQINQMQLQVTNSATWDNTEGADETWFVKYFMSLNEHLFNTLLHVSRTQEKLFTDDHMLSVGLDPACDRLFVMELAEAYGIDIITESPCCPS